LPRSDFEIAEGKEDRLKGGFRRKKEKKGPRFKDGPSIR